MHFDNTGTMLSIKQVGDLLQPYLPHLNAAALLKKDRQRPNPLLAFELKEGEMYYRVADVEAFLRTLLAGLQQRPSHVSDEITLHIPLTPQSRRASDQRRSVVVMVSEHIRKVRETARRISHRSHHADSRPAV